MAFDFIIEESQEIKGVHIITPSISEDLRGNIWTSFYQEKIEQLLPAGLHFKHDKFSQSRQNVLRGIHGDFKTWKYVTCVFGEIHQYVVDCRKNSPTYLKWQEFLINKDNQKIILIPPSMGNAYYVTSEYAVYHYKCAYEGEYIDAGEQFTFAWNDKRIGIAWPAPNPVLSDRDMLAAVKQRKGNAL